MNICRGWQSSRRRAGKRLLNTSARCSLKVEQCGREGAWLEQFFCNGFGDDNPVENLETTPTLFDVFDKVLDTQECSVDEHPFSRVARPEVTTIADENEGNFYILGSRLALFSMHIKQSSDKNLLPSSHRHNAHLLSYSVFK
jgi:hypothetical protein